MFREWKPALESTGGSGWAAYNLVKSRVMAAGLIPDSHLFVGLSLVIFISLGPVLLRDPLGLWSQIYGIVESTLKTSSQIRELKV